MRLKVAGGELALNLALSVVRISIVLSCMMSGAVPFALSAIEAQSPPLTISKSASPDPAVVGGELTYVLTITNTSAVALTGVVVSDSTPSHTAFLGASGPDLWLMTSPVYGGEGIVTWIAPVPLEPGQTVQLKFLVRVETSGEEPVVNSRYEVRADGLELPVTGEPVTTVVVLPTPTFTPPPTVPLTPTSPRATVIPTEGPPATMTPIKVKVEPTQSASLPQPVESAAGQTGLAGVSKILIALVVVGLVVVSATAWAARRRK